MEGEIFLSGAGLSHWQRKPGSSSGWSDRFEQGLHRRSSASMLDSASIFALLPQDLDGFDRPCPHAGPPLRCDSASPEADGLKSPGLRRWRAEAAAGSSHPGLWKRRTSTSRVERP